MRVYFIGGSYESCHYVRCLIPMIEGGWLGDKISLKRYQRDPQGMMKGAMEADIVVFHRPLSKEYLEAAKLLKEAGKKIVMDNDDTYRADGGVPTQMFGDQKRKLKKAVKNIDNQLKEFAKLADMVTVTTEFLKKEYEEVNSNVVVLPNCVDLDDWDEPQENDTGKIRLGIVGSVASNRDYENIIPLLDYLKGRDDVKIILQALPEDTKDKQLVRKIYKPEIDFWNQYNIEWYPFVSVEEYMPLLNSLKLDIMLIPRYDNYFNRCKSNVKFLEGSMCGYATVAQSFPDGNSPYEVDPEDKKNLILATTPEDWIEKVTDLINNKDKLEKLKKKARGYVINKYNIKNNINKWKEAYNKII